MRAVKNYLATNHSWSKKDSDIVCPHYSFDPESSVHAIITSPARSSVKDLVPEEVYSQMPDALSWTEPNLIWALGHYIPDTKTCSLPDLAAEYFTPRSPSSRT